MVNIFPEIKTVIVNSCISYLFSGKPAMHVDNCFKFKRYHTLERCYRQNFLLNTIWKNSEKIERFTFRMILSFCLKWRCFVNQKKLVEDKVLISTCLAGKGRRNRERFARWKILVDRKKYVELSLDCRESI